MRLRRNDPAPLAYVLERWVTLLLLQPVQLARELFTQRLVGLKIDQEAARDSIGDPALQCAEIAKIRGDPFADFADHRHIDQHPERRHAAGTAGELAPLTV